MHVDVYLPNVLKIFQPSALGSVQLLSPSALKKLQGKPRNGDVKYTFNFAIFENYAIFDRYRRLSRKFTT